MSKRIDYSKIDLKPTIEINIKGLFYEQFEEDNTITYTAKKICNVYKAFIGVGNADILIITNPDMNLVNGFQELCLYEVKDNKIPDLINDSKFQKLIHDNKQEYRKYKLIDSISETDLKNIIKEHGIKAFIDDFLDMNSKIDDRYYDFFKTNLITFGNCRPDLQKYNPHIIIIDQGKTGKSTLLEKICGENKFDSSRTANLLGFATADSIIKGSINEQFNPIAFDDFTITNFEQNFLNGLPSIMETGKAVIGKGKSKIKTINSSQITITANISYLAEQEPEDLLFEFKKIIEKIGDPMKTGTRFGLILFGNDFKQPTQNKPHLTPNDLKKNQKCIEKLSKMISEKFIKLFDCDEIMNFLEMPMNDFSEIINNSLPNIISSKEIVFWKRLPSGYRHINGLALKLGFWDYIEENPKIVFDNNSDSDINKVLKYSKSRLKEIIKTNLTSLKNIITIEENKKEIYKKYFEFLPEYLKTIIKTCCKLSLEYENKEIPKLIPFEQIQEYLTEKDGIYRYVSNITGKLPKNIEKINTQLRDFGLEIYHEDKNYFIKILDIHILGKFGEIGEIGNNYSPTLTNNSPKNKNEDVNKNMSKTNKNKDNKTINNDSSPNSPKLPNISEDDFYKTDIDKKLRKMELST